MYPAGASPDKELTDQWTWDFWLDAAGKLHKAGFPFGMPLGQTGDSMNWVGAIFAAHGAEMVTTEMVLFEWLRTAEHPQFRAVSKLIK